MANGRPPGSSMAARCTACSTVFRVVPDQLRVSEGWVRCGRCAEVFNAAENLIDLDTGTAHRLSADGVLGLRTPSLPASPPGQRMPAAPRPQAPPSAQERTQPFLREEADNARREPVLVHEDTQPLEHEDDWAELGASSPAAHAVTSADAAPLPLAQSALPPASLPAAQPLPPTPVPPADLPTEPAPLPSFVRSADRAARWRQPRVRAGMGAASLLLALLLGWQVLFTYRDVAAARWPLARAVLQPACALLGCSIEAARQIDGLSVESSGLLRVEKSDIYKLSVALRNRASIELALPALELSLTDPQGELIARRVLRTAELGAVGNTLAAGKELALQATLQAGGTLPSASPSSSGAAAGPAAGVAGYTIELFYP
jgi:predicted Zn finger-like uncharacterized protein